MRMIPVNAYDDHLPGPAHGGRGSGDPEEAGEKRDSAGAAACCWWRITAFTVRYRLLIYMNTVKREGFAQQIKFIQNKNTSEYDHYKARFTL